MTIIPPDGDEKSGDDPSHEQEQFSDSLSPDQTDAISGLPTDLDGLSYEDSKQYVIEIMTVRKRYQKDIDGLNKEISELSAIKVKLQGSNDPLKLMEAGDLLAEKEAKLKTLVMEEMELSIKLDLLKEALKTKSRFEPSVNSSALLESLEQAVGKSSSDMKLEKEIGKVDMESRLEELKRKMGQKE